MTDYVGQQRAFKADLLDVQTRLRKAEYEALTLRNTLATQQEQLNNLLGLDLLTEFQVSPVSDTTPFADDPETARRRALAQRPEVKEAQLKVQQAEYDRRMKKAEYIPDISLAFNYLTPFNVELVPKNIASVGVLLTWEPIDWGRKQRETAEKHKIVAQARHAAQEAEATVVLEVRSRLRKLQETAALLQVNQLAEETAKEKLRVAMHKYTERARPLPGRCTSTGHACRRDAPVSARTAILLATRAEFEKALGEH